MTERPYGLTTWHDPDDAEVDIVFVHGLRGNREATWTKNSIIWPKDLLAKDIKKSRIMSFGYDSGVVHSDKAEITQGSIESDARSLCNLLDEMRAGDVSESRPIITVAHSLGGLVCAQVVVSGDKAADGDSISTISKHIKGMVFLGTPFGGSGVAGWGEIVRRVYDVLKKTDQQTLKTLQSDSFQLRVLRKSFPDTIRKRLDSENRIGVVFFYERLATFGKMIVPEDSASYDGVGEILPMSTNHLNICKFNSNTNDGYKVVKAKILQLVVGKTSVEKDKPHSSYVFNNYGNIVNTSVGGSIEIKEQTNNYN